MRKLSLNIFRDRRAHLALTGSSVTTALPSVQSIMPRMRL